MKTNAILILLRVIEAYIETATHGEPKNLDNTLFRMVGPSAVSFSPLWEDRALCVNAWFMALRSCALSIIRSVRICCNAASLSASSPGNSCDLSGCAGPAPLLCTPFGSWLGLDELPLPCCARSWACVSGYPEENNHNFVVSNHLVLEMPSHTHLLVRKSEHTWTARPSDCLDIMN